jgi:glucose/arabinose dehydrogenase
VRPPGAGQRSAARGTGATGRGAAALLLAATLWASPLPGLAAEETPATRIETVARGLVAPWALAFAPDGRLFVTERPGRIRVLVNGVLRPEPVAELPVTEVGEGGLLGLALHPDFARTRLLYAYYTYATAGGGLRNRVVRLVERANRASGEQVLLDGIPGASIHDGGRLRFGPDGMLYVATGDAAVPGLAQDRMSLAGKILRVTPEGTIPPDNPFPASPVYSLGHRNPQGLAWHPVTGALFASEHGPVGNDELNLILPGRNYGWPTVVGTGGAPRFVDPVRLFVRTMAPSGMAIYSGGQIPAWAGQVFLAGLRGAQIRRVALAPPAYAEVAEDAPMLEDRYGRIRDVVEGPDGLLYFATSNRDGRGIPAAEDDRILRIVPGRDAARGRAPPPANRAPRRNRPGPVESPADRGG